MFKFEYVLKFLVWVHTQIFGGGGWDCRFEYFLRVEAKFCTQLCLVAAGPGQCNMDNICSNYQENSLKTVGKDFIGTSTEGTYHRQFGKCAWFSMFRLWAKILLCVAWADQRSNFNSIVIIVTYVGWNTSLIGKKEKKR